MPLSSRLASPRLASPHRTANGFVSLAGCAFVTGASAKFLRSFPPWSMWFELLSSFEGRVYQALQWLWVCLDRSYSEASRIIFEVLLPTRSSSRLARPDPNSTTSWPRSRLVGGRLLLVAVEFGHVIFTTFRTALHAFEQLVTSSQQLSHFFLQTKGR